MADTEFSILDPFSSVDLGIADMADGVKGWAIANRALIQPIKKFFNEMIVGIDTTLNAVPPLVMLLLLTLIAWQAAGRRVAILVAASMTCLGFLAPNAWGGLAMTTLAIVVSAVILSFIIGLPWASSRARMTGSRPPFAPPSSTRCRPSRPSSTWCRW